MQQSGILQVISNLAIKSPNCHKQSKASSMNFNKLLQTVYPNQFGTVSSSFNVSSCFGPPCINILLPIPKIFCPYLIFSENAAHDSLPLEAFSYLPVQI